MSREEQFNKIIESHNKYVQWWLPIDVESGSLMAPMSLNSFCESLLILDGDMKVNSIFHYGKFEKWWDRWENGFTKRDVMDLIKYNIIKND